MATRLSQLFFASLFCSAAWAQTYPAKSVRYIVSGSAGSGTDTLARVVCEGLSQVFGKPVIVENRPGGGSNIAAEVAAKAPADGYTLFQVTQTHTVNVTLYRNLTYSLTRDFAPVTQLAEVPAVLVVHPSLPAKSVRELIALARARPGAIAYGSGGTGNYSFFVAELFKGQAKVDMLHVPYRGGGVALSATIAGEVQVYFPPVATAAPNVRDGRLRALGVTTKKRVALMPEVPAIAEAGVPGFESNNWYGILVPAKTPKETVAAIRSAVLAVLNTPAVEKRLLDLGFVAVGNQPGELAAFIQTEIERTGRIVRAFKLTAD